MSRNVKGFGAVKRFSEIMNDDINRLPRPNFRLCFFLFCTQQTPEAIRITRAALTMMFSKCSCGNGNVVLFKSRLYETAGRTGRSDSMPHGC